MLELKFVDTDIILLDRFRFQVRIFGRRGGGVGGRNTSWQLLYDRFVNRNGCLACVNLCKKRIIAMSEVLVEDQWTRTNICDNVHIRGGSRRRPLGQMSLIWYAVYLWLVDSLVYGRFWGIYEPSRSSSRGCTWSTTGDRRNYWLNRSGLLVFGILEMQTYCFVGDTMREVEEKAYSQVKKYVLVSFQTQWGMEMMQQYLWSEEGHTYQYSLYRPRKPKTRTGTFAFWGSWIGDG